MAKTMIYIVVDSDRHCDPQPYPFTKKEDAIAWAREIADDEVGKEMLPNEDGVILSLVYSGEGDIVQVFEAEMDPEVG